MEEGASGAKYVFCYLSRRELITGPMVVFMLKHLRLAGCPFPEDAFQCHPCPITTSGGFSPQYGILLCQDRVYYKKRMEDTMAHELIHAFDHCRFKVDWNNLRHHACSEVSPRTCNSRGICLALTIEK